MDKLEDKIKTGEILSSQEFDNLNLRRTGSFEYFEFYESDKLELLILIKLLSNRKSYEIKYIQKRGLI